MREVLPICTTNNSPPPGDSNDGPIIVMEFFEFHERQKGKEAKLPAAHEGKIECNIPLPWASVWKGPQCIIFGQDARQGLQCYDGD
jgi:hypothetical protein